MSRILYTYSRFQSVRSGVGGLPPWARFILSIFALPGVLLVGLSILALGVSILALLLLTVPVYRLLAALTGTTRQATTRENREEIVLEPMASPVESVKSAPDAAPSPGRRQIDVKIIE